MPKSKEQKRVEALQRLRENIPKHRDYMMRCQRGGDIYVSELRTYGEADANALAAQEMASFRERCKAAGVDTHGNPL